MGQIFISSQSSRIFMQPRMASPRIIAFSNLLTKLSSKARSRQSEIQGPSWPSQKDLTYMRRKRKKNRREAIRISEIFNLRGPYFSLTSTLAMIRLKGSSSMKAIQPRSWHKNSL